MVMEETQHRIRIWNSRRGLILKRFVDNFLLFFLDIPCGGSASKFPHVAAVGEPMMGIADAEKMKRGQIQGVVPLFALPRQRESAGGGVTDVARSRARKCALASLCIFQETRVRGAAIK